MVGSIYYFACTGFSTFNIDLINLLQIQLKITTVRVPFNIQLWIWIQLTQLCILKSEVQCTYKFMYMQLASGIHV